MNTQLERPRGPSSTYEEDPHLVHDQDIGVHAAHEEHHGEKKSVLKKVKAKAKKIKDSIKEHVGHGHEVQEDDDDDDELDTDPETHGTLGQGVARQHDAKLGERNGLEGAPLVSKPVAYQTFDPTTSKYTPGKDQTLGWSRTDTGRPKVTEEQPFALRNTPAGDVHRSGGGHSTGHLDMGKKGPAVKLGGIIEKPTEVEIDTRDPRNVGEDMHSATYQGKTNDQAGIGYGSTATHNIMSGIDKSNLGERATMEETTHVPIGRPQVHGSTATQSITPGPHSSNLGERATMEGATHVPTSERQGYGSASTQSIKPELHKTNLGEKDSMEEGATHVPTSGLQGPYATIERKTLILITGPEETLGQSQTDLGMPRVSKDQFSVSNNTPMGTHSGRTHATRAREEDSKMLQGVLASPGDLEKDPHGPRGPGEELYPGNYESKVTGPTGKGGEEIGVTSILHQLDKMNIYDASLQKPTPTIGQEESLFRPDYGEQDEKLSTGSHDQFYPEPVSSKTSPFLGTSDSGFQFNSNALESEGWHDNTEQNQGSYTDKISSAATLMANKAKQATSCVSSKLGYGGSTDNQTESGGYGSVTTTIADKAAQAKDSIATNLGYSGAGEGQPMQEASVSSKLGYGGSTDKETESGGYGGVTTIADKAVQVKDAIATKLGADEVQPMQEGESKGGSIIGTVKDKIVAGYDKVADAGTAIASKVQGSGTDHEPGPTTAVEPADKGVSMKEYLVEKLKPGEEDKALSEIITEAIPLHKPKEDVSKLEHDVETKKVVITGRVKKSDEVARQLERSSDKSYDGAGVGFAKPGKGVIDRIYEATNSWFRKSREDPANNTTEGNQSSFTTNNENEQKRVEEPRLQ